MTSESAPSVPLAHESSPKIDKADQIIPNKLTTENMAQQTDNNFRIVPFNKLLGVYSNFRPVPGDLTAQEIASFPNIIKKSINKNELDFASTFRKYSKFSTVVEENELAKIPVRPPSPRVNPRLDRLKNTEENESTESDNESDDWAAGKSTAHYFHDATPAIPEVRGEVKKRPYRRRKQSDEPQVSTEEPKHTQPKMKARTPSPPKKERLNPITLAINRPYLRWGEIINPSNRRPNVFSPRIPLHQSTQIYVQTMTQIKCTKPEKEPDLALKAIHENPAAVLALGPVKCESGEDVTKERFKLVNKDAYARRLLPIQRNVDPPSHRLVSRMYARDRSDMASTVSDIERTCNRREVSALWEADHSTSLFLRVTRRMWPQKKEKTGHRGHKRRPSVDVSSECTEDREAVIDQALESMVVVAEERGAADMRTVGEVLNICANDAPFTVPVQEMRMFMEGSKATRL